MIRKHYFILHNRHTLSQGHNPDKGSPFVCGWLKAVTMPLDVAIGAYSVCARSIRTLRQMQLSLKGSRTYVQKASINQITFGLQAVQVQQSCQSSMEMFKNQLRAASRLTVRMRSRCGVEVVVLRRFSATLHH